MGLLVLAVQELLRLHNHPAREPGILQVPVAWVAAV